MLLYRKKVGKLKNLTYAEMYKIINNLPDKMHAEYKETFLSKMCKPIGIGGVHTAKYNAVIYHKGKCDK